MSFATIAKSAAALTRKPRLLDYRTECREFSWDKARRLLAGLPGGGVNMAYEALDRHIASGRGDWIAIRFLQANGSRRDVSYRELTGEANSFAHAITRLGLSKGDRVFSLLGREPAFYAAALGALKAGCVFAPLDPAFGSALVAARILQGQGRVLVTNRACYRECVASIRDRLKDLEYIFLVDGGDEAAIAAGCIPLADAIAGCARDFSTCATLAGDPALLHFTCGTAGTPKGAVHAHEAVLTHLVTGMYVLDLAEQDVFWCTGDPGWSWATTYGVIAPLVLGATSIALEGEFDAATWFDVLAREQVDVWYTTPTDIRRLMRSNLSPVRGANVSRPRFIASVGEYLGAEAIHWCQQAFGQPIHETWSQTETGAIMIANFAAEDIKPGSIGQPIPGVEAAVVERRDDNHVAIVREPGRLGELAIRAGWPSMFRLYVQDADRYGQCFLDGWYMTGDFVTRDAEGYYWFVGRSDDVIKSGGHLIGPVEVESALLGHPAVAEAAVIGKPEAILGETIKAYVVLKGTREPEDALRRSILGEARKRLGRALAPSELEFRDWLPRTKNGNIMRRSLRAQELGLPVDDVPTAAAQS